MLSCVCQPWALWYNFAIVVVAVIVDVFLLADRDGFSCKHSACMFEEPLFIEILAVLTCACRLVVPLLDFATAVSFFLLFLLTDRDGRMTRADGGQGGSMPPS